MKCAQLTLVGFNGFGHSTEYHLTGSLLLHLYFLLLCLDGSPLISASVKEQGFFFNKLAVTASKGSHPGFSPGCHKTANLNSSGFVSCSTGKIKSSTLSSLTFGLHYCFQYL